MNVRMILYYMSPLPTHNQFHIIILLQVEWADRFSKLETSLLLNLSRCMRRLNNYAEAEAFAQQVIGSFIVILGKKMYGVAKW